MKKLHKTQVKLLELLRKSIDDPLTIRELGNILGEDSAGVVHHHLVQLEKKGLLKRNPHNSKDYVVLDTPEKLVVYINKYGSARCGPDGLILEGNVVDRVPIASSLLKFAASEAFIVEARGDSMEPQIFSGDIVIGKMQNFAQHGELIICTYKEEVLIKQLLMTEDGLILFSLNKDKYAPRVAVPEALRIEGVVKNILHYS